MHPITKRESKRAAIISGAIGLIGFALLLATRGTHDPAHFWHPYIIGTFRLSLLMVIFGFIWCALSTLHLMTDFFDLDRPIEGTHFSAVVGGAVLAVIILIAVLVPRIPRTAPSQLPPDPKRQMETLRMEGNFRGLVGLGILAAGAAVASVPCRRFFRK